jgi:ABC-type antimicrobial peptide transport system permease subunit
MSNIIISFLIGGAVGFITGYLVRRNNNNIKA